jgi:hypothetical protein
MKLSPQSLKILARVVNGDGGVGRYRRWVDLEELFHGLGFKLPDDDNSPSRFYYTLKVLSECNETSQLVAVVKATLDARQYVDHENLRLRAVEELNKHFRFDGYEIEIVGDSCQIVATRSSAVVATKVDQLDDDFVREQLQKCEDKMANGDCDGAVSNARSLIEGVLGRLYVQLTGKELEGSGDLQKDFKKVRELLQMSPDKYTDEPIRQVLNGFNSIVQGVDSLSNKIGDRHRRRYKPADRHARLVTNAAKTIVDFLIDGYNAHKKQ